MQIMRVKFLRKNPHSVRIRRKAMLPLARFILYWQKLITNWK